MATAMALKLKGARIIRVEHKHNHHLFELRVRDGEGFFAARERLRKWMRTIYNEIPRAFDFKINGKYSEWQVPPDLSM